MRNGYRSVLDNIMEDALEEYFKNKLKDKREPPKKKESKGLGFFEGLVVAYIAQILYGPLTKLVEVYVSTHGVH